MKKIIWIIAAVMLLASCVSRGEYEAQVKKVDSLMKINAAMQKELDGYKYAPEKLIVTIRENYTDKDYNKLKKNYDLLRTYHPEAKESATAKSIYEQSVKDQEAARKKAEEEKKKAEEERKAKMKPIERIMEKYSCDEYTARMIQKHQVQIGMTARQCEAAWGRPRDINRTTGSWGVHEQWCYDGVFATSQSCKLKDSRKRRLPSSHQRGVGTGGIRHFREGIAAPETFVVYCIVFCASFLKLRYYGNIRNIHISV